MHRVAFIEDLPVSAREDHWNAAYGTRGACAVSWFDPGASESVGLVAGLVRPGDAILDVGGGASDLASRLVADGLGPVTVLDLSQTALAIARARAGASGDRIVWIAADITRFSPPHRYRLWHDRAVFHFLTDHADRAAYVRTLAAALDPGGHAVISTFAQDGPTMCSGLAVVRYAPRELAAELDAHAPGAFAPVSASAHLHRTPGGAAQSFQTSVFRRLD